MVSNQAKNLSVFPLSLLTHLMLWVNQVYLGNDTYRVCISQGSILEMSWFWWELQDSVLQKTYGTFSLEEPNTLTQGYMAFCHCKLVLSKLPKVVSINKVLFLCDFICTNRFLPVSLPSSFYGFWIHVRRAFHFRKSRLGLGTRKVWGASLASFSCGREEIWERTESGWGNVPNEMEVYTKISYF